MALLITFGDVAVLVPFMNRPGSLSVLHFLYLIIILVNKKIERLFENILMLFDFVLFSPQQTGARNGNLQIANLVFVWSVCVFITHIQGSYTFLPTNFHDFSMTFP